MTKILHLKAVSTFIFALLFSCAQPDSEFTYYGPMGPDHWSEHYNQCSGKHQSPVNINDVDVVNHNYSAMNFEQFDVIAKTTKLFNNGHTVLVQMSFEDLIPTISGGPLEGKGTYQFQQLHFHWGENNTVGSEDRINDLAFPMELHVVFRNTKYDSFEKAARKDDGVAVLAAFYEVFNNTNLAYANFTKCLQYIHEANTNVSLDEPMNLFSFLSPDLRNYYTYIGSLTTPPCSEDVIWIDYSVPIQISAEFIQRFRNLKTFDGSSLTHNFRPIQPLNNRKVYRAVYNSGVPKQNSGSYNSFSVTLPFLCLIAGANLITYFNRYF